MISGELYCQRLLRGDKVKTGMKATSLPRWKIIVRAIINHKFVCIQFCKEKENRLVSMFLAAINFDLWFSMFMTKLAFLEIIEKIKMYASSCWDKPLFVNLTISLTLDLMKILSPKRWTFMYHLCFRRAFYSIWHQVHLIVLNEIRVWLDLSITLRQIASFTTVHSQ